MSIVALEKAIEIVGGQTALARILTTPKRVVRQGHVWAWLNRTGLTPPEFCIPIEDAVLAKGGNVTRHDLRPDVFGPPKPKSKKVA